MCIISLEPNGTRQMQQPSFTNSTVIPLHRGARLAAARPPARDSSPPERAFREWLSPDALRAVVDDRPDAWEYLASRAVPEERRIDLTRALVWSVMLLCVIYAVKLWVVG
jgi:hypothetical protein